VPLRAKPQVAQEPSALHEDAPVLPARALPESHILLGVEVSGPDDLFAAVAQVVSGPERPRPEQVVQRLWQRHRRSSPALGAGIALPHAAVPVIRTPLAVYLRLRRPCRLRQDDEHRVGDILALLVPLPGLLADYDLFQRVRNFLQQPEVAEGLRACNDAAAICRLLTGLG
jgi:PTS system nitrogen regulatory IIA component